MSRSKHFSIETYDQPVNHHPVDDIEPIEPEHSELAESLVRLIVWILSAQSVQGIAARSMTLGETLGIQEPSLNWSEIGDVCGVTREVVRQNAVDLEEIFQLRAQNRRTELTREHCRLSRNKFLIKNGKQT